MAEGAAGRFRLEVMTPQRVLVSEEVTELVAPGVEGYFGILPGRAPFITLLKTGEIFYRRGTAEERVAVASGYAEVRDDRVTILADAAERAEEIDVERADRARRRAEERLQGWATGDERVDQARALAALQRALTRLEVARKSL